MTDCTFESPFGRFELARYPARRNELLRAWDAADEYLLQHLAETSRDAARVLLCNDGFGALSIALNDRRPVNWSDSWLAHEACRRNLDRNDLSRDRVELCASGAQPFGLFDRVLIKLPKSLALLDYQLACIKHLEQPPGRVWLAGMQKNLPSSLWQRLEAHAGTTSTLPARKKAKLIELSIDPGLPDGPGAKPVEWALASRGRHYNIANLCNVFSRESLDIGARFFIEHMPHTEGEIDIADLGCGNGVLGLIAAASNPLARVHFVDESWMAIESARRNLAQIDGNETRCRFEVTDGLTGFARHSLDLVLCNPPFHQQHAVGDMIASSMFAQAARCLRDNGELWVVGNRHLGYHRTLRRWFGQVETVASNQKFVVLRAANILA